MCVSHIYLNALVSISFNLSVASQHWRIVGQNRQKGILGHIQQNTTDAVIILVFFHILR